MDDTEDDARYPPNSSRIGDDYGSSDNPKRAPDPRRVGEDEPDEEETDDDEAGLGYDDNMGNGGVPQIVKDDYSDTDEDDYETDSGDMQKNQKKRKLKSLLSSYEFAPRVPAPGVAPPKPSVGGRNPLADWSEHETFVLLDAWGERFLKQGRKSLRSEEWQEVAKKVSQESKVKRTDTQCRNRLDTLKKKYKKEKTKLAETRSVTGRWVYFRKMDMLLSSNPQPGGGALSCGVDSGEYVVTNPKSHLSRANELDEARDSPGISVSVDNSDGLPPKRTKMGKTGGGEGCSFKLLADSIHKFSEIYEKIENSKRQQMMELEKMRMDFHRGLEAQKRQILERAKVEIAKIRQGDYEENASG